MQKTQLSLEEITKVASKIRSWKGVEREGEPFSPFESWHFFLGNYGDISVEVGYSYRHLGGDRPAMAQKHFFYLSANDQDSLDAVEIGAYEELYEVAHDDHRTLTSKKPIATLYCQIDKKQEQNILRKQQKAVESARKLIATI